MTTSQAPLRQLTGATAYDRDGDKLGRIGQVYFDDNTDQPKWITVNTGLFGMGESFVPLQGAQFGGDFSGERAGRHERRDDSAAGVVGHATRRDLTDRTEGYDTSGPTTDTAMTRSEEHLRAGTETQEVGRARLRKHVVTEHEQVTVPVSHEEVRVERQPITDANRGAADAGPAISEEEHEVTLRAERPVVTTEAEAVERVRLGTETVREQETVGGEVRKEQIELDDDARTGGDRRR